MSKQPELPQEVWVVFGALDGKPICEYVAAYRQAAMEHAADAADVGDGKAFAPWRVARYVLADGVPSEIKKPEDERARLREAQAKAVMPLIGNLLDQWESVPNDLKDHIREIQEGFEQAIDDIQDAMEGEHG